MKKTNKIHVVVSPDLDIRLKMLKRVIIDMGFALTPSDAGKIIKKTPYDKDLAEAYFVFAEDYNFRDSIITTQRLYEMAARGIAIVLGMKRIPPEFEFICTAYYPENFARL